MLKQLSLLMPVQFQIEVCPLGLVSVSMIVFILYWHVCGLGYACVCLFDDVCMFGCCLAVCPVSALKPEEFPEVRVEKEERQSASYEVHHQKLVRKHTVK